MSSNTVSRSPMKSRNWFGFTAGVLVGIVGCWAFVSVGLADDGDSPQRKAIDPPKQPAGEFQAEKQKPAEPAQQHQPNGGFPDLVTGLKQTEGCLGVDVAEQTMNGKTVIFAWFEDKAAVARWYHSDVHQQAMAMFFGPPEARGGGQREPLPNVADDIPIMMIAAITMAPQPELKETTLPVSQISIEAYTPLSGGLFLGGKFAPDELEVKGMEDYTPKR